MSAKFYYSIDIFGEGSNDLKEARKMIMDRLVEGDPGHLHRDEYGHVVIKRITLSNNNITFLNF